jgi:hypothetical protein
MHSLKNLLGCIACKILFLSQVQFTCPKGCQSHFPSNPNFDLKFKFLSSKFHIPWFRSLNQTSKFYFEIFQTLNSNLFDSNPWIIVHLSIFESPKQSFKIQIPIESIHFSFKKFETISPIRFQLSIQPTKQSILISFLISPAGQWPFDLVAQFGPPQ